jgi:Transglutaminase-like superfamily
MIDAYRRFVSLDRARRALIVEAAAATAAAWVGLRVFRFLTLRRLLERAALRLAARTPASRDGAIDAVRWAITAVAARLGPATCLVQALAADAMLRRRGIAAEVRFGVRARDGHRVPIEGHAWVECDGQTIGAARQPEFGAMTR